jgi:hypothetical protein
MREWVNVCRGRWPRGSADDCCRLCGEQIAGGGLEELQYRGVLEGEFDTSITTVALARTPLSPSPVRVMTPVFGDAATASWG